MATELPIPEEKFLFYPVFDNFVIFFINGAMGDEFRKHPSYITLQKQEPSLERRLRDGVSAIPHLNNGTLAPYNHDLYRAYLIMRKYVDADSDIAITARPE